MLKLISQHNNCPVCFLVKKNPNRLADTSEDWSSPHHFEMCTCLCIPHFACSKCIGESGMSAIHRNNVSTQYMLDPGMSTIHRNNVSTQYMLDPDMSTIHGNNVSTQYMLDPGMTTIHRNNVSTQYMLDPGMSAIHRNNVSTQYMLDPGSQALASASVHCPFPKCWIQ